MQQRLLYLMITVLVGLQSFAQSNIIVTDKDVKIGKLTNGLTYYIRKNAKPESRVELRLIVNAGSVLEKDNQQGVAHFLEHMAFNGTAHFPKNELLSYLQKAGVRFGADINATTSFDFTMYMLPLPTTDESVLQNGYQVLRDWAGGLLLDTDEIEKERGVILEEKRMRQNANMRSIAKYFPVMTNNSMYSKRIPIGKEELIKNMPRSAFLDFYTDWYRPDNMAIIAVGDIDVNKTEAVIRTLFDDLKNPAKPTARPAIIPINWHQANKSAVVSDPENTNSILTINFGLERSSPSTTWELYGEDILSQVITNLFSKRLQEEIVKPKSPISFGNINLNSEFLRGYKTADVSALVKNSPADAMNLMLAELIRARQFGFTQPEFDRIKKNMLKNYEDGLKEKDKTESSQFVNEYFEHFLNNTPAPGIEAEQKFAEKYLNELTLEKINKAVNQFDLNKPAFILFNATESHKNLITEAELTAAFEKAKQQTVEAYFDKKVSTQLMEVLPFAGKISSSETNSELDTKILTLANGIKVIYKKTNYKNDEIVFRGSQWGGKTNLTDEEVKLSKYYNLVGGLGLGKNKAADMSKVLTGVNANAIISVASNQLMVSGNSGTSDLEKLFQLLYLKLTNVNFDEEDFEGLKSNFSSQITGIFKNPALKFNDTLNQYKFNYNSRASAFPLSNELNSIKMESLKALHLKLTSNLNGMILVFVGNIDEGSFVKLVEKYIAAIPTQPQPVNLNKMMLLKPLAGKHAFSFKAGKENKSEINHSYYGETGEITDKENFSFTLLSEILQMKANEKLREEMGSTYAPAVRGSVLRSPLNTFNLTLSVAALPENVDEIIAAYEGLINDIINGIVSEEDLAKAKAQRLKVVETQKQTNVYWSTVLDQQVAYGFSAKNISDYEKFVQGITKEDIISTAKKYLANSNVLKGVMNPE